MFWDQLPRTNASIEWCYWQSCARNGLQTVCWHRTWLIFQNQQRQHLCSLGKDQCWIWTAKKIEHPSFQPFGLQIESPVSRFGFAIVTLSCQQFSAHPEVSFSNPSTDSANPLSGHSFERLAELFFSKWKNFLGQSMRRHLQQFTKCRLIIDHIIIFFCLWKANLNLGRGLGPLLLEDEGATEAAGIGSPISSTSIGTSAPAVALWLGDCDWLQLSQSPSSSRISITELQPGKIWELMLKEHMRATCSATCNETKCPCGSGSKR